MSVSESKHSQVACIQQHNSFAGFSKQHTLFCAGYKRAEKGRVACEDEAVEHVHYGCGCGHYCATCSKRVKDTHTDCRTSALVRLDANNHNGRHS